MPKDPFLLLSFINTRLRDSGEDFNEICRSENEDPEEIRARLKNAGFEYHEEIRQFR